MELINNINDFINNIVWGIPLIVCILGIGIYYTIRLGFPQITKLKQIYKGTIDKMFHNSKGKGAVSSGEAALVSLGEIIG